MRAEQFIKDHGLDEVKDAIKEAETSECFYINAKTLELSKFIPSYDALSILELKRLVESVDLIEHAGGLKDAKKKLEMSIFNAFLLIAMEKCQNPYMVHIERIKQAIQDYESIYGEGNE